MMVAPAVPSSRLEPVCSGCQWVLKSVRTGPPFGSAATAFASAAAVLRESAIHQNDAVWAGVDNDVAARAAKQIEVFAQWCGGDVRIRALREAIAG